MISRWPIRLRLAAVFTGMMALVLAGVGWVVLAQFAAVSDTAINQTLDSRADQIAAPLITPPRGTDAAEVQIPGGQDSPAQLLDTTNRLIAATPTLTGGTLLSSGELHQARAGTVFLDRDQVAGLPGRVRLMAQPFTVAGHPRVLVVAASLHDRDAAITDLRAELLVGLPIVLLAAAVGGYLLAAAALRPVEAIRSHAAAITGDRPDHLPLPAARDEIHRLAQTLNIMLDRLHTALTRERDFLADASHELRTPLGQLRTELELALRRPRPATELTRALRSGLQETEHLCELVEDLLLLARADNTAPSIDTPATGPESIPVVDLLTPIAIRYRTTLGAAGRVLHLDCPDGLYLPAHTAPLQRAVANLLDNALQHGAGPITLRATTGPPPTATVEIHVTDHGPGFPPAFLPVAFDRFTRPDNARTGTGSGLGLSIAAALTRSAGGHAYAANHPDGGADVWITIPTSHPPGNDASTLHERQ